MGYDKFYSGHSMDAIVHKYIIYIHSSHKIQGEIFILTITTVLPRLLRNSEMENRSDDVEISRKRV